MSDKKYKVLFLLNGVWREYKSNLKLKDSPSALNLSNAQKVKRNLSLDPEIKAVKLIDADSDYLTESPFKVSKLGSVLDNIKNPDKLFQDNSLSLEFKNNIDFQKTNYIMKKDGQVIYLLKNSFGDVLFEYKYEKIKELTESLKEEFDKILIEIQSQSGRIYTIDIEPALKKKGFIK